jgi:hypothetical protein
MRRLLASFLLLSCSPISSDADVTLDGTLLRHDKRAAASVKTVLVRVPDPLELLTQGITVVSTLGLACLNESSLPICKTVQSSTTDNDGRFHYEMKGSDVKGSFGQVSLFQLAATLPNGGASMQVGSFSFHKEALTIPGIQLWEPTGVMLSSTPADLRVRWDAFGGSHGHEPSGGYTVRFSADAGGDVWVQSAATSDGPIDARAVEDTFGRFTVAAHDKLEEFDLSYRSAAVAWSRAGSPVPLSRGKPCLVEGTSGPEDAGVPCPLSNGAFGDNFAAAKVCAVDAGACTVNRYVQVDLGAAQTITTVFAHGLSATGKIAVETSTDGASFTEVARVERSEPYLRLTLPATTARWVRLRVIEGTLSALSELSVW